MIHRLMGVLIMIVLTVKACSGDMCNVKQTNMNPNAPTELKDM